MTEDISKLKYWLSIRGNTKAKLAAALGYDSSVTIQQWIDRDRIPEHQVLKVLELINGDIAESGQKGTNPETALDTGVRTGWRGKEHVRRTST
jgi:hypothetical protein